MRPAGRRKLFEFAELQKAPVAIEREVNGKTLDERRAIRHQRSKPIVDALETWLHAERKKLSTKAPVAKAIDYSLKRWRAFTRFLAV